MDEKTYKAHELAFLYTLLSELYPERHFEIAGMVANYDQALDLIKSML